jgi:hypothetical protein
MSKSKRTSKRTSKKDACEAALEAIQFAFDCMDKGVTPGNWLNAEIMLNNAKGTLQEALGLD